jgi:hypothetical protein
MIGFYYKRKGLQKLFEDVFGKFEIEKEKKKCPFLRIRPEGCCCPPLRLARSASGPQFRSPAAFTGSQSREWAEPSSPRPIMPKLRACYSPCSVFFS